MNRYVLVALFATVSAWALAPLLAAQDPAALRQRAAESYAQGSYELALQAYRALPQASLAPAERRWIEERILECDVRSAAATENPDPSRLDQTFRALLEFQKRAERPEQRDQVWAEAEEALGDVYFLPRQRRDWNSAWEHYLAALEWWAGSSAIETARARYLGILFRVGWPERERWFGEWWQSQIPLSLVENAIRIATSDEERAWAQFLYAVVARQRGADYGELQRALRFLESAVAQGKRSAWHDDALFLLAQWLETQGIPEVDEEGQWRVEPDLVRALALYRELEQQYAQGESRYVDDARRRIEQILAEELALGVESAFLPDSEVGFHLQTRNLGRVDLALYPVDLAREPRFENPDRSTHEFLEALDVAGRTPLWARSQETHDDGRHLQRRSEILLEPRPGPGAYLLVARAGKQRARELVLVGTSSLVTQTAHDQLLVWASDALSSAPIGAARLSLWVHAYQNGRWRWTHSEATSGADGTALFPLPADASNLDWFVAAAKDECQAFALGDASGWHPAEQGWKLFAFTDRPAYRPGQSVSWKVVARTKRDGRYVTPAQKRLGFRVSNPRGEELRTGELGLNAFGSGWGELETQEALPLGEYSITFFDDPPKLQHALGSARLFRLEEYKLPEFEVSVSLPETDGKPRIFRLGDRVEASVDARYYFGGTVANATVEVIVHQRPFFRSFPVEREFPWYFDAPEERWWGGDQIASRQTVRTDAEGHALVSFDTPANSGQELEYTLEARVTDASRREVAGSGRVRVTRTAYAVQARSEHNLFRPGTRAAFVFRASDANERPVVAQGKLTLLRSRWRELWQNPRGERLESRGAERPDELAGWTLVQRGYVEEEVESTLVSCDAQGLARWEPLLAKEGYYTARWTSRDDRRQRIEAATSLWCSDERSAELGYRSENLEILLDQDSARAGTKLPLLLSAPVSGRWVLFTVASEGLHSWQVLHLDGTLKLVELPLTEQHVPNVFLSAASFSGGNLLGDTKELVVPPVEQFLDVKLEPDRSQLQPGEQGAFTVTVRDHAGRPVAAEIGLAVVDESVLAIQSEYNPDPRPFFFGEKRGLWVEAGSQQSWRGYARWKKDEQGRLVDARQAALIGGERDERMERDDEGNYLGRAAGSKDRFGLRAGFGGGGGRLNRLREGLAKQEPKGSYRGPGDALPAASEALAFDSSSMVAGPQTGGSGATEIVVRSDFRETALWKPDLVTDESGTARLALRYPESLTRWKARARAFAADARLGTGVASVRTQKPLQARLQAPRFFVVGDNCTLSALIDNQGEGPLSVEVKLEAQGLALLDAPARVVEVPARGELRVDWRARAEREGRAELVLSARSGALSDAMKMSYPVAAHGIEALVAGSWKLAEGGLAATLEVPAARRRESTRFTVQVAPSLAVTMLDALPYLVEYPYGCTEQTLSRFLPAAIVSKTLRERGLSVEDALGRVFGGIEEGTPRKAKNRLAELEAITRAGLDRLFDFQHADGGWGWWKEGESDEYMSAYVVWGLALARDGGIEVRRDALERGAEFLSLHLVEAEEAGDLAAWMLHALAAANARESTDDVRVAKAFDNLWKRKERLNAYAKALFALAAQGFGREREAHELVANLANGAIVDETPEASAIVPGGGQRHPLTTRTAHWGQDRIWSRWSDGAVETTSFVLRALAAIEPQNALVDPTLAWLLKNRRAAQWSNTRDTAIAVLALDGFLRGSNELGRDVEYEVVVNGKPLARRTVHAAEMLRAPSQFELDPKDVRDGANAIEVRILSGQGPLYVSARAEFFSLEEPIPARGSQVFVARQYFKLVARPTLLKGIVYERVPLVDGGSVASGERVEVVLTAEAKTDLEYVLVEDQKPAGLEAVEVKSGGEFSAREIKSAEVAYRFGQGTPADAPRWDDPQRFTGRARWMHAEWRDRKVALFVDKLAQGVWEMRYELRAEVPGEFHALPVLAQAMYVPEIKGNSAEVRLRVTERKDD